MKKLFLIQSIVLLLGTLFAWYNVVIGFVKFYKLEGTIFKVRDCVIPNPVTEACFYGAIAFAVAFVWSVLIQKRKDRSQERYLLWLLIAGSVFAWYNVITEFIKFYSKRNEIVFGCSATPIVNPFVTPCFYGACLFLIATVTAGVLYFYKKEQLYS